ncbi:MAG: sigma-54-dependent Fis family transcriptional regulator [Acidobacteria bacterium]|nr:sigma-54-dependent Fis family transcriptional regulator [Acidobacteriota bacterium]MBI3280572.1 sigma-54-dependent Fis family transcriptional regulator [Acidobacteriota bacterium]
MPADPCALPRAIIGTSPRMQQILRQIGRLHKTRWPVLILGETGTGKELVARAIHVSRPSPFVIVDCSALVGNLIESDLFGYAKGAFTGAATNKAGLLDLAHGGTAFFDEIGELEPEVQGKLLRVLQEKEFRPLGSLATHRSDFRLIAATNRDLEVAVANGAFRRDLFYRLNVVTLRLPPLRDRREDIPVLVRHFFDLHGQQYSVTQEVLDAFTGYDWPGNVRELENVVQRMVAMNSGPLLHIADLPTQLQNHIRQKRAAEMTLAAGARQTGAPATVKAADATIVSLMEIEKRAISDALRATKGDRTAAAVLLGIGRTTLYRKLKEYAVDEDTLTSA